MRRLPLEQVDGSGWPLSILPSKYFGSSLPNSTIRPTTVHARLVSIRNNHESSYLFLCIGFLQYSSQLSGRGHEQLPKVNDAVRVHTETPPMASNFKL